MSAEYWNEAWGKRRGVAGVEFPFRLFCVDAFNRKVFDQNSLFLDIGCGSGAGSRLIEDLGACVVAVDISTNVRAHVHCDIRDFECAAEKFDCIFDLHTMCLLENPPYTAIHRWLKPGGWLYSMYPTDKHLSEPDAWDVKEDFSYCSRPTIEKMQEMMQDFASVGIREYFRPVGRQKFLSSWCVEAQK